MPNNSPTAPNGAALVADTGAVRELADIIAAAHGFETVEVKLPEAAPVGLPNAIVVGFGPEGEAVDLRPLFEAWRDRPERKIGTAKAQTLDAFMSLTRRHASPTTTAIFADTSWRTPSLTAVLDYHDEAGGGAGHCRHRVHYPFPLSEEWKAWVAQDAKPMSQGDFAAFIEDHIADLSSPTEAEVAAFERDFSMLVATPADVIQLSRGLAVQVDAKVKSAITLQTGEMQVLFEEAHVGPGSGSPLKVPGLFVLAIAPFFLGERIRLPVRLRYRVTEGRIVWRFHMFRPDFYVAERIREDLDAVRAALSLPCFEAAPEAS